MAVLTAAVVVLGILCVLNLAVTAAVIRRLRTVPATGSRPPVAGLAPGSAVPQLALRDERGEPVTRASLLGHHTLVAFFATDCPECSIHAPELVGRGAELGAAGVRLLTALVDTGPDRNGLRRLLGGAGTLLVGEASAELAARFATEFTPAYFLVGPDGTVLGSGPTTAALPLPVPAG
ncbi:TlpA family protein disulfide reductase [Streptomyces polygonati]|uniref:TlpA family protein disulfide reductase n=1 Tax=Streptomyces polygonati TaxID=1617087 RepID=A0ABV8HVW0_9ACTN